MSFIFGEHIFPSEPQVLNSANMVKYFTNDDCLSVVKKKLGNDKFDLVSYELEEMDRDEGGFNEKRRRLSVRIKEAGSNEWRVLDFFVKELSGEFTSREPTVYSSVLPLLGKYITGKVYPECYMAKKNELVILEDLSRLGYRSISDKVTYDSDQIEATLTTIAKLHSASLIYENKHKSQVHKLMPELLQDVMFIQETENPLFDFLCASINAIESISEVYFSHIPKNLFERANKLIYSIPERLKLINKNAKVKVFTHADLWNNNIMFKYGDDDKVESAVIYDFQLAKYTTPAYDVLQAICLTTSTALREAQFQSLLIHYFNHLSRELAEADISVHGLITWSQFEQEIYNMLPVMLAITPVCLHFMLLPKKIVTAHLGSADANSLVNQDRSSLVLEAMRLDENYRKRISHTLIDLYDYLKDH